MLPKRRRLSAREVREVLRRGRSLRAGAVSVRYMGGSTGKAAVVVSRKVAGRAVERNRLRRAGYRALSVNPSFLPQDTHVVFFIQKKEFDPKDIVSLCLKLS